LKKLKKGHEVYDRFVGIWKEMLSYYRGQESNEDIASELAECDWGKFYEELAEYIDLPEAIEGDPDDYYLQYRGGTFIFFDQILEDILPAIEASYGRSLQNRDTD
jgi:hypothetical protein